HWYYTIRTTSELGAIPGFSRAKDSPQGFLPAAEIPARSSRNIVGAPIVVPGRIITGGGVVTRSITVIRGIVVRTVPLSVIRTVAGWIVIPRSVVRIVVSGIVAVVKVLAKPARLGQVGSCHYQTQPNNSHSDEKEFSH